MRAFPEITVYVFCVFSEIDGAGGCVFPEIDGTGSCVFPEIYIALFLGPEVQSSSDAERQTSSNDGRAIL